MSFAEFWEDFKKDYEEAGDPVWNMSRERYNALMEEAKQIYEKFVK